MSWKRKNKKKKDAVVCAHCGRIIDVDGGLSFSNLNFKSMYDLGMGYQPMYYYDWNDMSWKNSKGRKVNIEDVDPYMLSYEDEDAYYAQKNGKWDEWCANEYGLDVAAM